MGYIVAGITSAFLNNTAETAVLEVNKSIALAAGAGAVDTQNAIIAVAAALAVGVLIYIKRHRRVNVSDE